MARFLNHYTCPGCDHSWEDEWSCMVDDECGECGASFAPNACPCGKGGAA